jgi:hypothetical protein
MSKLHATENGNIYRKSGGNNGGGNTPGGELEG